MSAAWRRHHLSRWRHIFYCCSSQPMIDSSSRLVDHLRFDVPAGSFIVWLDPHSQRQQTMLPYPQLVPRHKHISPALLAGLLPCLSLPSFNTMSFDLKCNTEDHCMHTSCSGIRPLQLSEWLHRVLLLCLLHLIPPCIPSSLLQAVRCNEDCTSTGICIERFPSETHYISYRS